MRKYQWIVIVMLIGCMVSFTSCEKVPKMMDMIMPDAEQVEPPEVPEPAPEMTATVEPPAEPMVEMEMEMPETIIDDSDPSQILYLSFDELDGNQAMDHSRYHNHGMLVGNPQLVDGKFGKALEFNGETDAVEVPHHNSLTVTEAVTVMGWIHTPRSHHPATNWQGILAKGDQHPRSYSFYTERGGTLQLSIDNADANTVIEVDGVPIHLSLIHISEPTRPY